VNLTWLNVLTLVENIFSLLVVSIYIIAAAIAEGDGVLFIIACPFVVIAGQAWVFFHSKRFIVEDNRATMGHDDNWSEYVAERSQLRPLITNYRWGQKQAKKFEKIHEGYNDTKEYAKYWWGVTLWRVATVAEVVATIFLAVGGTAVLQGQLHVGTFVTSLGAISEFGGLTGAIFQAVFDLMKGYASVVKISELFNTSTRRQKLKIGLERRSRLVELANKKAKEGGGGGLYDDTKEEIVMHDVSYEHEQIQREEGNENKPPIERFEIPRISAVIEAGSVIALTGSGSTGKTTLMRIMARHYIPTQGWVSYPDYWRVRLLDAMDPPYFFKVTN
jgi:ABC-type multidrug transport system fused ATPase/permease subunit